MSASVASVFAALGDDTRLALVARLCAASPQSIAQLTEGSALTRQGVTKHLRVLEDAGIVASVKAGRESHYAFKPQKLAEVQTYLEEVSRHWDEALGRLKTFAERD